MSNPIPSSLALTTISNGTLADATPVQNNLAEIQAAVNELITALSGGAAGQLLSAVDGTDVQWASAGSISKVLDSDTRVTNVSTSGTTFAAGADLLATPLSFTSDGSSYLLRVMAVGWFNNTGGQTNVLRINLNGADAGSFASNYFATGTQSAPLTVAGVVVTPSAGSHTINARLTVGGGQGTVLAGAGGAGLNTPLLVTIEKI